MLNHLTSVSYTSETSIENRNQNGFVIVETNYRVYAYTDSTLQLAILSTFTEMLYRFFFLVINSILIGIFFHNVNAYFLFFSGSFFDFRFNDMSVGVLSREAVRRAFQVFPLCHRRLFDLYHSTNLLEGLCCLL